MIALAIMTAILPVSAKAAILTWEYVAALPQFLAGLGGLGLMRRTCSAGAPAGL